MFAQPRTTMKCGTVRQRLALAAGLLAMLALMLAWTPRSAGATGPDGTGPDTDGRQAAELEMGENLHSAAPRVRGANTLIVEHVVQEGDTVVGIASRYGLDPQTIVWANNMEANPHKLSLNQSLLIPPVDGVVHTVQTGDTLASIAARYVGKAEAISQANALTDGLKAGQRLIVPDGVKPKPTPRPVPTTAPTQAPPAPQANAAAAEKAADAPTAPKADAPAAPAPQANAATAEKAADAPTAPKADAPAAPAQPTPQPEGVTFTWPLRGTVSQGYLAYHRAIDILAPPSTAIKASAAGTVTRAGWSNDGYGYNVVLEHGSGYRTLYAHLNRIDVKVGQTLQAGEALGGCGATGRATAFHLHFEVYKDGVQRNPIDFLK